MRGRQRLAIIALMLLVAAVAVAGTAGAIEAGGRSLSATLTGAAEVPGPGDPEGAGTATLTVNPGLGQICYELTVSGIAPATAAHIHLGAVGVAGPVVVPLAPPTGGSSSGCAAVSRELALAILKNPSAYYFNVHNAEFPAGAVRGQLAK
jgi:CHRD domain-containing protein